MLELVHADGVGHIVVDVAGNLDPAVSLRQFVAGADIDELAETDEAGDRQPEEPEKDPAQSGARLPPAAGGPLLRGLGGHGLGRGLGGRGRRFGLGIDAPRNRRGRRRRRCARAENGLRSGNRSTARPRRAPAGGIDGGRRASGGGLLSRWDGHRGRAVRTLHPLPGRFIAGPESLAARWATQRDRHGVSPQENGSGTAWASEFLIGRNDRFTCAGHGKREIGGEKPLSRKNRIPTESGASYDQNRGFGRFQFGSYSSEKICWICSALFGAWERSTSRARLIRGDAAIGVRRVSFVAAADPVEYRGQVQQLGPGLEEVLGPVHGRRGEGSWERYPISNSSAEPGDFRFLLALTSPVCQLQTAPSSPAAPVRSGCPSGSRRGRG